MCNRDEGHDYVERVIVGFDDAIRILTLDA